MPITPVPCVPEFVSGLINLRGKVISIINLRLKLGIQSKDHNSETCIVVVNANGVEIGIIVDAVSEVITIKDTEIKEVPAFSSFLSTNYLLGIGKVNDQVKLLLDIDYVLSNNELNTLHTLATNSVKNQEQTNEYSITSSK
jgi:purine-binding chemotaxis protein CheW